MSKCDWCSWSYLDDDGVLQCPYKRCVIPQYKIDEILNRVTKR